MLKYVIACALLPILIAGSMIGSYDSIELRKLPNVVEHYNHHVNVHGEHDLSFLQFLADHYSSETERDVEHENLPALGGLAVHHSVEPCQVGSAIDFPCQTPTEISSMSPEANMICFNHTTDVFQPPRMS